MAAHPATQGPQHQSQKRKADDPCIGPGQAPHAFRPPRRTPRSRSRRWFATGGPGRAMRSISIAAFSRSQAPRPHRGPRSKRSAERSFAPQRLILIAPPCRLLTFYVNRAGRSLPAAPTKKKP